LWPGKLFKGGELPPIEDEENNEDQWARTNSSALGLETSTPLPGWVIAQPSPEISTLGPANLFNNRETSLRDLVPPSPLVSELETLYILREEYERGSNYAFLPKIDWLMANGMVNIRRTRSDGDCFYRASAFAYIDHIINATDQDLMATQAMSVLDHTYEILINANFPENDFESRRRVLLSIIHAIAYPEANTDRLSTATLVQFFNDEESKSCSPALWKEGS